jgi:hypothetical protein
VKFDIQVREAPPLATCWTKFHAAIAQAIGVAAGMISGGQLERWQTRTRGLCS